MKEMAQEAGKKETEGHASGDALSPNHRAIGPRPSPAADDASLRDRCIENQESEESVRTSG